MMPTIRIEDDVFEGLKTLAEPFTDTPNSVIRKLLQNAGVKLDSPMLKMTRAEIKNDSSGAANANHAASNGGLTPQPTYEKFLHYVLATNFNGRGAKHEVTKAVIQLMKSKGFINSLDMEIVKTGETKAENTIAWGRNALKDAGVISNHSPRGLWELTTKGLEQAKGITLPSASTL